jgi:hypothetical protein
MKTEHRALIHWSQRQQEIGLPEIAETTDPAWFEGEEGWSLVCRFASPPAKQGNPSEAVVNYLFENAPHEQLSPGAVLQLFERDTMQCAQVEIVS